ncbi:MAG: HAD hydrolase-like protein [Chloroflexota bacterium]
MRGASDILAGNAAGCRCILVRTGWGANSLGAYRHTWVGVEPHAVADDLLAAARILVDR